MKRKNTFKLFQVGAKENEPCFGLKKLAFFVYHLKIIHLITKNCGAMKFVNGANLETIKQRHIIIFTRKWLKDDSKLISVTEVFLDKTLLDVKSITFYLKRSAKKSEN